jgi:hypothetical protein
MKSGLLVSMVLFAIACCPPALEFKNSHGPNDVMLGLRALAVGWSGIFAAVVAWYANPVWVLGLLLAVFRNPCRLRSLAPRSRLSGVSCRATRQRDAQHCHSIASRILRLDSQLRDSAIGRAHPKGKVVAAMNAGCYLLGCFREN